MKRSPLPGRGFEQEYERLALGTVFTWPTRCGERLGIDRVLQPSLAVDAAPDQCQRVNRRRDVRIVPSDMRIAERRGSQECSRGRVCE